MRTLLDIAGEQVCSRFRFLVNAVEKGTLKQKRDSAEEAIKTLCHIESKLVRKDEKMMVKDVITSLRGASQPQSRRPDCKRLRWYFSIAMGDL